MKLPLWLWRVCRNPWTKRFLIASPVLLTAAIVAFYGIANWYGERAIQDETEAMKATGWPVTLEEVVGPLSSAEEDLFQHPAMLQEGSVPEKEKIRDLRTLAGYGTIKGISRHPSDWESIPGLDGGVDVRLLADPVRPGDPEEQVAKDLLIRIEGLSQRFDEMKAAFRRPGGDWHFGTDSGRFIRSFRMRFLARFALDRAQLRLAAGETAQAFEDVEVATDLAGIVMQRGPGTHSFFQGCQIEGNLSEVIWEGVKRQAWNEAQLAQLQPRFEEGNRRHHFRRAVREQLAYAMSNLSGIYAGSAYPGWNQVGTTVWEGVRKRNYGKLKEAWNDSWGMVRPIGLVKLELRDEFAWFRAFADWLMETPATRTKVELDHELPWSKIRASNPQFLWFVDPYFNAEARRTVLLTGIALERYRLKHGTIPQTLEVLVPEFLPEVPKDIYDGEPLRYHVLPDGAPHVWSIWPSGKDEGGIPSRYGKTNTVWTTGRIPGLTEAVYNAK